jgi:hypothetical protein
MREKNRPALVSGPRGSPSKFPESGNVCTVDKARQLFQPESNQYQALDLFTWSRIKCTISCTTTVIHILRCVSTISMCQLYTNSQLNAWYIRSRAKYILHEASLYQIVSMHQFVHISISTIVAQMTQLVSSNNSRKGRQSIRLRLVEPR